MNRKLYSMLKSSFFCLLLATLGLNLSAQNSGAESPSVPADNAKIPLDPNVRTGTLPNGMKYYVRANKEPENRAELRLAVNVGSMMEDEDQLGLAHFTEHMAFNGTKHFKKSELVDYLESIGTKFGAHLNAYTSFDETVYMLQIPTDDQEIMDKAFLVLEDWAHGVSFEHDEIDKERGVVIEEWRLGRGPEMRMMYKYLPVVFSGSRYADRLPIGKKEILESFDYETIKRFYNDWYRPELMSVVAVGDFDPDEIEAQIKKQFGAIPKSDGGRKREMYDIPDTKGITVAVETDEEAPYTMVQFMHKQPKEEYTVVGDYKDLIIQDLVTSMINSRLEEIQKKGNSPFVFSQTFYGSMVRARPSFMGMAMVNNEKVEYGIEILLREVERARRHGFISTELEREKTKALKRMEKGFKEAEKTESRMLAMEYVRNFLEKEPTPGIEMEYKLYQHFLPEITLEDCNKLIESWVNEDNAAVIVTGPEKEDIDIPSKEVVAAMVDKAQAQDLEPYKEEVDDRPLISKEPTPGKVTEEKNYDESGVVEWQLSNGARVVFKQTDFKEDEVRLTAFSKGGASKSSDSEYMSAVMSGQIVGSSGVGPFDETTLQKKLAGKIANVRPYVGDLFEGFYGSGSPDDFETMLQLIYLYFNKPRKDSDAFEAFMTQMESFAAMSNSPDNAFRDSVSFIMSNRHPRERPLSKETLGEIDLMTAYMTYIDRFSDASDFTFIFVGNVDPAKVKPVVEKYLGGLPGMKRKENWKDQGIRPPSSTTKVEFKKGMEPKSMVAMNFTGIGEISPEEAYHLKATMKVLSIMLRESMREEKGGVYGVRANESIEKFPEEMYTISIGFGCSPDNARDLIETALKDIQTLKTEGASEKNLAKAKETHRRERETDLKENSWWLRTLTKSYREKGEAPKDMDKYLELVEKLTSEDIKKAANKFFNMDRYVEVVMFPEK